MEGIDGESLQANNATLTGWQPIKTITSAANRWYTPALSGDYAAGEWNFTLWTAPAAAGTEVSVALYKTNAAGNAPVLLGSQTLDVSTTGTGNHPSQFSFNCPTVSLANERLMVQIECTSGQDVVMCYNTNDFPTRLVTP